MHRCTLNVLSIMVVALLGSSLTGCHSPAGAMMPYTGATQTLYSTENSPKTIRLVDTRSNEVRLEIEIPVGKQFTYDFVTDAGDDPVESPDLMRYELFPIGTKFGKLRNAQSVPNSTSRRIDWYIREGTEYSEEPPEYRMRVDKVASLPDWWTPKGGPLPEDPKTTMYDN